MPATLSPPAGSAGGRVAHQRAGRAGRTPGPASEPREAPADPDTDLAREEAAVRRQRAMLAELTHTGHDPAPAAGPGHSYAELEQLFPARRRVVWLLVG
ncbi:hypothetical protein [Streptosporangium sp. NPDC003464]